jgi:hypothetical protein
VTKAQRIIEELREGRSPGQGRCQLDGKMIDAASEKMAAQRDRHCRGHREPCKRDPDAQQGGVSHMDIHEYQAKEILARFGVPVPARRAWPTRPEQAAYRTHELGGFPWVVKAQIHSGGRGEAGGVKVCKHR